MTLYLDSHCNGQRKSYGFASRRGSTIVPHSWEKESQKYLENSNSYDPWISDVAFKILSVWLIPSRLFFFLMIWEIKRLNLLQNGNTSLAGTQEGGYSAFLKADYILGLITLLLGLHLYPQIMANPPDGLQQPVIFMSHVWEVWVSAVQGGFWALRDLGSFWVFAQPPLVFMSLFSCLLTHCYQMAAAASDACSKIRAEKRRGKDAEGLSGFSL